MNEPSEQVDWPQDINELPTGDRESGKLLYATRFGCAACHGHPEAPGTHTIGPHLGDIAADATHYTDGHSAAAYVYESLLDPDAIISPNCPAGLCRSPSMMPPYDKLLTLQAMADLIAYLIGSHPEHLVEVESVEG